MLKENSVREVLPYGKPKKSFDLLGFLKRYGIFILLLGSSLFTMLTPFIFVIKKPYYEVHAFMKVDPIIPTLMTKTEESSIVNYYDYYANTLAHTMKSFSVLKKAVEKLTYREKTALFPPSMSSDICADILRNSVSIKPMNGTHLLELSISGDKPGGLAPLLNKLMEAYIEQDRSDNNSSDNDKLRYLYDQKHMIQEQMAIYERDLDSLTKQIYTSSFNESNNIANKSAVELLNIYNSSLNERIKAESGYREIAQYNNQLKSLSLDPLIDEMVMNNPSLLSTDSWTNQQMQEMRSTTDGLTENNPDRVYVETRMEGMKQYQSKLHDEIRNKFNRITYGKRNIEIEKELLLAKTNYNKASTTEKYISKELEKALTESKRISIGIHKGEYISTYWQHKHQLLDNIDTRITELEVERKAPLRLSIESLARTPGSPLKSNTNNLIMMFLIGSFAIVGGAFFVYEFFDNTIRRPEDIELALGYPPTQTIIKKTDKQNLDTSDSLAPKDFKVHAIGSLAIKFCREKEKDNTRIILFTGIEMGVGSSSISFASAKALAQLSSKILMIDGDLDSSPVIGTDIGTDDAYFPSLPGLCDYLCSNASWKDFIISTPGDKIDIMYAGNLTGSTIPRERISELLREVKKEYDFICIDAPPLMQSHLTEHFSIYSDIIALTCLGDSSKYNDLRKCADLLIRLGVPAIAPILNFGGVRQTLTFEEMFENPPDFIKNIIPNKLINTAINSLTTLSILDKLKNFKKIIQNN